MRGFGMKLTYGAIGEFSSRIENDLLSCAQSQVDKRAARNLATCAACALAVKSANSCEWKSVLPSVFSGKSKELYIRRVLSSPLVKIERIMLCYAPRIVKKLSQNKETVVLMMDQSQIHEDRQILMISLRLGNRALPILWKIEETKGSIGFDKQEELLNKVKEMIPPEVEILLSADRFYGTKNLVEWCQKVGWKYRLRLKGNLIFQHEGGEITSGGIGKMPNSQVIGACFNDSNIKTNIGYLHEEGHQEPWIIAMDCIPSKHRVLDYGMRWGIECMFSDFKSRGFAITDTHVRIVDRMEKLILILTIGLYWAVSVGASHKNIESKFTLKKNSDQPVPYSNLDFE